MISVRRAAGWSRCVRFVQRAAVTFCEHWGWKERRSYYCQPTVVYVALNRVTLHQSCMTMLRELQTREGSLNEKKLRGRKLSRELFVGGGTVTLLPLLLLLWVILLQFSSLLSQWKPFFVFVLSRKSITQQLEEHRFFLLIDCSPCSAHTNLPSPHQIQQADVLMVMASTVTATDQRLAAGSDSGGFWDYRTSRAVRRWRHILRLRSRITIENIWRVTPGVEEDYDTGGDVWSLTNWSKLLLTNLWVVEVHYG